MTDKQTLFISYCQKDGAEYADELEIQLRDDFEVKRDKSKLKTNNDIYGFMSEIAECDNVIIVLTNAYTKSLNCMLEMAFLFAQSDWDMKSTVLVIDEALYSLDRKLEVLNFWDIAKKKVDVVFDGIGHDLLEERKEYIDEICLHLEEFLMGVTRRKNPSQIAIVSEVKKNAQSQERNQKIAETINLGEQMVIDVIKRHGKMTVSEIAAKTNKSMASTRRIISSLVDKGMIQGLGSRKMKAYQIIE